ncbi:MAG: MFS transporter, partial [Bacteroidota bacterium]
AGDEIQSRERAQALGFLEAANGLGKVISPLAGAALALISWWTPFFVYGALSFPIAAAVVWCASEKRKPSGAAQSLPEYFRNLARIIRGKGAALLLAFLAGMAVLFTLFGVLSFFSDVLEKTYHIQVFGRGLILALPVLAMAGTSFILGTVLKKKPAALIKPFIFTGLLLVAGGLALFALLPTAKWGMIPPILATILVGLGTGASLPPLNTLITSAAPRKERGGVTCLYGTVRFFGVAIGPPVFALGMKGLRLPLYLGIAGGVAALAALCLLIVNPGRLLPKNIAEGENRSQRREDDWDPSEGI